MKTLHITSVYNQLNTALHKSNLEKNNDVLFFFDDLTFGQLFTKIDIPSLNHRHHIINLITPEFESYTADMMAIFNEMYYKSFDKIVIWHTDNVQDRLMLFLFSHYFLTSEHIDKIYHCYIPQKLFIDIGLDKARLGLLNTQQLLSILDKCEILKVKQIHTYAEQWQYWHKSKSELRLFETNGQNLEFLNGCIKEKPIDYFDEDIFAEISTTFLKASLVIAKLLTKFDDISSRFFHYRICSLVQENKLNAEGDLVLINDFEIKKNV